MVITFWIVVFCSALLAFSYKRASLMVTTIGVGFVLLLMTMLAGFSSFLTNSLWVLFVFVALVLNISWVRRTFLTGRLFTFFKRFRPSMSETERAALGAGSVGWEGELFKGFPNWDKLLMVRSARLSSEEQAFMDGPVETLCGLVLRWQSYHQYLDLPDEIWQVIKSNGFLGLIIPKRYGGKQFSAFGHGEVITKIASVNPSVATIVSVPNSLGPAELILRYGTDEQKNHYLPRLASGEEIPCFALTSPRAGSDAGSLTDYGIVCKKTVDGQSLLGIRLYWDKRYITLAPVATLLGLAFKLYDPDHLLGEQENLGITCALVQTDLPGITIGRRHYPIYGTFPNGPTQGHDVFIPIEAIIGGPKMAGQGWRMLMECLAAGRAISLPSIVAGCIKAMCLGSGAYTRVRKQFNAPIARFGGVEEALTRMAGFTYMNEAMRVLTLAILDQGEHPAVASAIAKYNYTEFGRKALQDAMDVHGGKAICLGPRNYLARSYITSPVAITVEGANILTRSMIIFGQGAIRCHPYVLTELEAADDPDVKRGLQRFDSALMGHVGFMCTNLARVLISGITNAGCIKTPAGYTQQFYRQFSRMSAAFALVTDFVMLQLGAQLKREEKISGRLADMISYLYIGSAVLKYYQDTGAKKSEFPIVAWTCQDLLYRLQQTLLELLDNIPNSFLGGVLRRIIFPLGLPYKKPNDQLGRKVAEFLITPSSIRSQFAEDIFMGDETHNPLAQLGSILPKIIAAEPLERMLQRAIAQGLVQGKNLSEQLTSAVAQNIFTQAQADELAEIDRLAQEIIAVDDFSLNDLLKRRD